MSYKRTTIDAVGKENSIITVNKLSKPNIKDKISLWERKDLSGSNSASVCVTRKSSLNKSCNKEIDHSHLNGQNTTEEHEADVTLLKESPEDNAKKNSCKSKNEIETCEDVSMNTPVMVEKLQFGSLKRNKDSTSQERKAVFSLFKKLEAMDDGRTTAELGNYFSPLSRATQEEERRKNGFTGQKISPAESINPVPKPRRTFQHPSHSGTLPRGPRHLPPLPSHKTCVPRCPREVQGEEAESAHRKSLEPEHIRSLLPRARPPEHHYEDILDKENPYEDIELESSCSQQSLASSPGADTNKTLRAGFFRQSSSQSLGTLHLRSAQPCVSSRSTRGATSNPQHSPPRTPRSPRSPDPNSRPHCDTSNIRTSQRTPTMDWCSVSSDTVAILDCGKNLDRLRSRPFGHNPKLMTIVTDDSTSESELEDRAKAHRQRLVSAKSILSRPSQSSASRAPVEHQRRLFECFVVVSLQKSKSSGLYQPEVTQQFPPKLEQSFKVIRESENQLRSIPLFCFPDATDWEPVDHYPSEMFSFVLTGVDGSRRFGYCRRLLPTGKGKRLPEVYCIISHLGCFNLFSKVLDEVERRRALSPALVQPFMRAILEAQCPAPGKSLTIRTFLPGSGTEVMELSRPPDSRLEHVDFECLLSSLSLRLLLGVFSSLLLERRVIFTAHKLSTLSQCCHAALALLYPFVWQHTYIPVLPSNMLDIVCTPTPFFVGLLSSSLPQLRQLPLEEVLVVDLGGRRFLRQLDDEDSILPCKLQSALENVLERRQELASERGDADVSTVVSEAFVRLLVELVGHYPLFVRGEREDGYSSSSSSSTPGPSSFQRDPFRKAVPSKSSRRFLELFMETQMFSRFVQERELRRQAPRGLFEVRVHEYLLSIHDNDHRRVNRFLKGLGNKMKFLSKK